MYAFMYRRTMTILTLLSACLWWTCQACTGPVGGTCQISTQPDTTGTPYDFPYSINEPEAEFELDNELEEISGLSMTTDQRYLVGIQDEDGKVFLIDPTDGKINEEIEFWKDGDYEGVEVVGDDVYVVKSSGTLYRIQGLGTDRQKVDKFNDFLNGDNDVEGLAYDAKNGRLLLACKAASGADTDEPSKSIYSFPLDKLALDEDPAYCIRKQDVQDFLGMTPMLRKVDEIVSFFDPDESDFDFSPSALAIHPISGDLYILSSVGKMLMVIGDDGTLRHLEKLEKKLHEQPEGLCFAPDGTMYLSNEAGNEEPMIYRYTYRKRK